MTLSKFAFWFCTICSIVQLMLGNYSQALLSTGCAMLNLPFIKWKQ